jgi:hypothetical protein
MKELTDEVRPTGCSTWSRLGGTRTNARSPSVSLEPQSRMTVIVAPEHYLRRCRTSATGRRGAPTVPPSPAAGAVVTK